MNPPRTPFAHLRGGRTAAPAHHTPAHGTQGSVWLAGLSAVAILLLLLLSVGLLLAQRDAALERAEAQTKREVQRLADELEQTLRMAQAGIAVASGSASPPETDLLGDHRPLVESLALPFELHRSTERSGSFPPDSAGQWLPGLPLEAAGHWHIPLTWLATSDRGVTGWEVRLSREALLARFASEQMPTGSAISLFRIEQDGATTVLARYPYVESEQGRTFRSHLATAVARSSSGVFKVPAQLDGIQRVVGYRLLEAPGHRLVVAYGMGVEGVLAPWNATLPWAILLTVLVAGAMTWGSWRLARSLRELRRSQQHFQTLSQRLPDVVVRYDRNFRVLFANAAVERAIGLKPEAMLGLTLPELGTPPEVAAQWIAYIDGVFSTGKSETLYFSYTGPGGVRHWEAQAVREPALPGDTPTVLAVSRDITERREAEARRDAAQRLFEAVFLAAPDAMSLSEWDSGRLLLVNDAFCELFGRAREDLIGRTSAELGLWRSPDGRQALLDTLSRGEPVRNQAASSSRPDGQEVHVRYSAERVQVDGQERLLLMFRDVTQLERDQRALARSELRFRLAGSHGQVWEWDFESGDFSPSQEFFLRLGHRVDSNVALNQLFGEVVHPEDLPRVRWHLLQFLKGERPFQMEFRAQDGHGAWRWFEVHATGLRNEDGRVTYMAGTAFDITDRKSLEEAQRQTLTRLETLTNASEALLWTSRTDGSCDWVNQRWLDFTGQHIDDVVGEGWGTHVHPDDLPNVVRAYENALEERTSYSGEFRLRNAAGEYRWLLEQSYPRYDADNRFIGYICSCVDITDFKRSEATARERGAMLEQVFDVLQDMLFVVDTDERYVFFQAGHEARPFRPPGDFLGKRMGEVMPDTMVQQLRSAMAQALSNGPQELSYRLDLPGGERDFTARLAWLPGEAQCMFLVRDTTEQQSAQRERERLNRFVMLLFRLASRFINLPVHEADTAINEALGDMGRFIDADRAYLFEYDHEAETASNTHEWCGHGVAPAIDDLQKLPYMDSPTTARV